ncbi:MAG: single-stranded DNA-binding protein [Dysgonamonadaceae bacterium]|jgi:single-strand DNA-binding protein|nr:single-stranded DNA-binding protein [Dysgonamonadaceae bacterium]
MSINKVTLIGNVGKDPEVRYFDNGGAVANFTLATTERGYTAQNGTQIPERTEWHNIVLWRGLAETAEKYIKKGSKLYIEGKIRSRSYDDQNGNKRYVTEIYGDVMEMLSSKSDGGTGSRPPFPEPPAATAKNNQSPDKPEDTKTEGDDDMPF